MFKPVIFCPVILIALSISLQNGTLKICDRKKNIFKLSQGEYIAPEKIENIYIKSQYVAQVFVHGESLKSCTVAVIVPDVENVKFYAEERGIPGTLSVLCNMPEIKQLIMNDITDLGKKGGLKSFEQVQLILFYLCVVSRLLSNCKCFIFFRSKISTYTQMPSQYRMVC